MKRYFFTLASLFSIICIYHFQVHADASRKFNAYNQKLYTVESEHFRLSYPDGLKHVTENIGEILERLYDTYRNKYNITLPNKTEVLISDDDMGGGWALAIQNTIHIWSNDFDWNLRGTVNWLDNVVAHEYAHIVSIWTSFKMPSWMPYMQFGYFTHPNTIYTTAKNKKLGARIDGFYLFPSEILPPWFFEGIAQYESMINNGDKWDTHRDMILRSLVLSDKLQTWDHISVFTGKEDDYEKTYNHGFSLVKYISEEYGDDKIVSILREASKFGRVNFDRAIKASLGISGRELYNEWSLSLKKHYTKQIDSIGTQVYGVRINKDGFSNYWPRFSPNDKKIYFLSNGKKDFAYYYMDLYSYNLCDTVKEDKRIKMEMPNVKGFYSIHDSSAQIAFSSFKSKKSILPPEKGGIRTRDIFIDKLPPPDKKKRLFSKKTESQITEKKSLFHAAFSPSGDKLACSRRSIDRFYLTILDTSKKNLKDIYPDKKDTSNIIKSIYSIDWSPDGKYIAISYLDKDNRKIGIYDRIKGKFYNACDTEFDERDPRFSSDSKTLYFSSDRTGIFNIYRYNFKIGILQRITNVSGGAFTPDISKDETRLVYANYDSDGYGIYLIDSIKVLDEIKLGTGKAITKRESIQIDKHAVSYSPPFKYNRFPRKILLIPTFFIEQILSENDNPYKGITNSKAGGVLYLNDPFDWADRGSSIGFYFISETLNPFKIFDSNEKFNREISYDMGCFLNTKLLPVDFSFFFAQRAIAGMDDFRHDYYGNDTVECIKYNLNPLSTELKLTHNLGKTLGFNIFTTYDNYKIWTEIDKKYYSYCPAKGNRIGSYLTFRNRAVDSKMNISPKGIYSKLKYEFYNQSLINEEKAFSFEDNKIKENYDNFLFNQISGNIIFASSMPFLSKHDIALTLNATALKLTSKCKEKLEKKQSESLFPELHPTDLPSFYKPAEWIPGYTYYYRDTVQTRFTRDSIYNNGNDTLETIDSMEISMDTLLVSGNGIISGSFSYRFPLTRRSIDKKFWFLYLDRIYGALNFGGATAADNLSDFRDLKRNNFLLFRGIELRLEAISFNSYPLAISARWDYGIDKNAPIGGHKFTLKIGFRFEDWDIIVEPDGRKFFSGLSF